MTLILDPPGFDAVRRVHEWLEASGHLEHGCFSYSTADPAGTIRCACGEALVVPVRQP